MGKNKSDYGPFQELMPNGKTKFSATKRNANLAFFIGLAFAIAEALGVLKGENSLYIIFIFLGFSLGAKVFLAVPELLQSFRKPTEPIEKEK